ncbi:TPA: hypothetical protein DIU27_03675 [Candidatus Collierbacteria bacterium]|uniref:Peptidase C60 family protein n=1 Tax=Candidatus Collierbacteria bacterium GW2011_GWB2_44_22 TaxID=1618387 RepID=A0A0G1HZ96_9BACT|nr:MAG: Peptidase C60 family protein [Candidatus Collierbacteria bacterium GW2011_GWA2_44_13]KKT49421.1 MAG: Peptidase C60 family protein [Candidatus Collierbacteria bacterium GW2011_GWB1_44_197]KKT52290.1 MAG: Peptidase C60 family protein [Candidatus Collierbacteria bacterium GW2011_GWB2_44_22]KKT63210.1 MAG: Peptidase C60 family protein [Candidatus Collierbacteria bacterium GW2011_GWD1_44_27]KKT66120.1 MAG: Peptidase C60 family protein [Candidatus Collierbacteria bacterium GW2011_GWC2_44_30]
MKSKISLFIFIAFSPIFLASLGFTGGRIFINSNIRQVKLTRDTLGVSTQEKVFGIPIRLKIPTINVNASIQSVGLDQDGEMGVPESPMDVGWLDLESVSGSVGSAVISGHLNQENGDPGVFAKLNQLKEGDYIFLEKGDGEAVAYVIGNIRTYDPGYAEEVFASGDGGRLSLITCDGTWDKKAGSYSKRLVVTAQMVL